MIKIVFNLMILSILFTFCFCSFTGPTYPNVKNLHKVIIFDQSMSEDDIIATRKAMRAWECSTNGKVQFTEIKYPNEQELSYITDIDNSIVIENVPITDARIIGSNNNNMPPGLFTVALYMRNKSELGEILIVKFFLTDAHEYELYAEHELGHSLGLEHIEGTISPEIPIMDPIPAHSNGITNADLLQLAQIYGINFADMKVCH